jgi:hypothetical protein
MTDTDKLIALSELFSDVIDCLSLKSYKIEDPAESDKCVTEADNFYAKMLYILYPDSNS